jgi:glycosyltransferase involved in cell wall biosynthesis
MELCCYEQAQFASVIERFGPDLIHAHFATEPTAAAKDLAHAAGVPFTFTAHGYDIFRKPPSDFGERAKAAAAVITVSNANAAYIRETFSVPAERVHVIPCGVDQVRFRPTGQREKSSRARVVCVARHVKVKNLPLLLNACALLRERKLGFECVLVGDGPCREELETLAAQLKLEESVAFAGAADQDEVLRWWQKADVAVLSSQNEGLPVSLIEASACGVPVVAPSVGGIPEFVLPGVTGILTRPDDPKDLADALERLLSDTDLRTRVGNAARERVNEVFSLSEQVDRLLRLWGNVLHDHH